VRAGKCLLLVAAVACAASTGACGHTRRVGNDRTLELGVTEYRVIPQSVRVKAGFLTILVHNYGRTTHNLIVSLNGISAGATKPIFPGDTATLTLILIPGKYVMESNLISDQALGAYGTLVATS
jgi:hypothetical protein